MRIKFYKYQGTGNDFVLINGRELESTPDSRQIKAICDRRFGIGADGVIIVGKSDAYDFTMRYYNSDGNESTMCGNGGRCAVAFTDFLSRGKDEFNFQAIDGIHTGIIISRQGAAHQVRLRMKDVEQISSRGDDYLLDTGSPHLVRFAGSDPDVVAEGRAIRNDPDFLPGGINVNFVRASGGKLHVRTYERGVEDETLSCGTGVTASVLAYAFKMGTPEGRMEVSTTGGRLWVEFIKNKEGYSEVWLTGPATRVFEGFIDF